LFEVDGEDALEQPRSTQARRSVVYAQAGSAEAEAEVPRHPRAPPDHLGPECSTALFIKD
jgi:hypothetical protein